MQLTCLCITQQPQKKQVLLVHIKENIHVEFWLFQLENVAYGVSIVEIAPTNISVIVIKRQQGV